MHRVAAILQALQSPGLNLSHFSKRAKNVNYYRSRLEKCTPAARESSERLACLRNNGDSIELQPQPNRCDSPVMFEGFQGDRPMMPKDASLSDSYTPDLCSFSSLFCCGFVVRFAHSENPIFVYHQISCTR